MSDINFLIEMSKSQKERLADLAKSKGQSVSDVVRNTLQKGLEGPPKPKAESKCGVRVNVRVDSSIRRDVVKRANSEGKSVREWFASQLDDAAS